ncbi:MAG TPA: PIN/TRAM domain-containing protein [Clostridia bacterium]|nr:PIN/TRAM domain-containing protein [Clostridia bacterium]
MIAAGYSGFSVGLLVMPFWQGPELTVKWALVILLSIVAGLIGYSLAPPLITGIIQVARRLEALLYKIPAHDLVGGAVGLIIGLIIANLFGFSFYRFPIVGPYLSILASLVLGYLGWSVGTKKRDDLFSVFANWKAGKDKEKTGRLDMKARYKILDTSVIIDGRIADICKSGFIDGVLLIPQFVLEELRHIADSSDLLKRNRGRRGLDILNRIQKELDVKVKIDERDFDDLQEVDSKLIRLAQLVGGDIITNDFNLNKVAELQGVRVLNINELANAVKPVVLPGEEMTVQVIKDGKEVGQGIGYLDDGTMIVVENGRKYIGQTISVLVTSVLQTAAGRMIFAKPKPSQKSNHVSLEVPSGV